MEADPILTDLQYNAPCVVVHQVSRNDSLYYEQPFLRNQ